MINCIQCFRVHKKWFLSRLCPENAWTAVCNIYNLSTTILSPYCKLVRTHSLFWSKAKYIFWPKVFFTILFQTLLKQSTFYNSLYSIFLFMQNYVGFRIIQIFQLLKISTISIFTSFSSSNTRFIESQIFYLFTFWVPTYLSR